MISYWHDPWRTQALKETGSRCANHALSLKGAVDLQLENAFEELVLIEDQSDKLEWQWETSRKYSAKSVYTLDEWRADQMGICINLEIHCPAISQNFPLSHA